MTLRHDIKVRRGDAWTSPTWAVIMPGGLGVDLTDGWDIQATVRLRRNSTEVIWLYAIGNGGVRLGQATVTLSDGTAVTTSTVELHHDNGVDMPLFVGPWDCQITKDEDTFTIAEGTFRVVGDVTT